MISSYGEPTAPMFYYASNIQASSQRNSITLPFGSQCLRLDEKGVFQCCKLLSISVRGVYFRRNCILNGYQIGQISCELIGLEWSLMAH